MPDNIAYQLDDSGIYVGEVTRQPSPLEPGVFLVPGGAVTTPPPTIPTDKLAQWDGTSWALIDKPV